MGLSLSLVLGRKRARFALKSWEELNEAFGGFTDAVCVVARQRWEHGWMSSKLGGAVAYSLTKLLCADGGPAYCPCYFKS